MPAPPKTNTVSTTPTDGVRLLLELESEAEAAASYRGSIYTPDATFTYRLQLQTDGTAEVQAEGPQAPADLEKKLTNIAKSVARATEKKRADGLRPWPPRVLRWRR